MAARALLAAGRAGAGGRRGRVLPAAGTAPLCTVAPQQQQQPSPDMKSYLWSRYKEAKRVTKGERRPLSGPERGRGGGWERSKGEAYGGAGRVRGPRSGSGCRAVPRGELQPMSPGDRTPGTRAAGTAVPWSCPRRERGAPHAIARAGPRLSERVWARQLAGFGGVLSVEELM